MKKSNKDNFNHSYLDKPSDEFGKIRERRNPENTPSPKKERYDEPSFEERYESYESNSPLTR